MLEFWKRAVSLIFDYAIPNTYVKIEHLKSLFLRKSRRPMGLENIMVSITQDELIKRGDYLDTFTLSQKLKQKQISESSWSSWFSHKLKSIVATEERKEFVVVDRKKLDRLAEEVKTWAVEQSLMGVLSGEQMKEYLKQKGFDSIDMNILLDYMYVNDQAITQKDMLGGYEILVVKVRTSDRQQMVIGTNDTAYLNLKYTLKQVDAKLIQLENQRESINQQVRAKLRSHQKQQAKQLLIRQKAIESVIEQYLAKRQNVEEQLLNLMQTETNTSVIKTLKHALEVQKSLGPELSQVEELQLLREENKEINEAVESLMTENLVVDDDLLKELEELDTSEPAKPILEQIPTVPTHELPGTSQRISTPLSREVLL